ncbi:MAG: PHP domain-containing protein, partial [Clostridia bacterium]|nr:PHP domain-containing protein [Clostridia bacterium]
MRDIEFLSLFNECLDKNLNTAFKNAEIISIQASLETRSIEMRVRLNGYVKESAVQSAKSKITSFFSLKRIEFDYFYSEDMLCDKWLPYLADALSTEFAAGRSFLDGAQYEITDNLLTITLKRNGKDILTQLGAAEYISKTANRLFGRTLSVNIVSSNANAAEQEEKELLEIHKKEMPKAPVSAEKPKAEKKKQPPVKSYDDLPISLTNAKSVFGPQIKTKPVNICDIDPEEGTAVIWGDVFDFDARETKDGKKNIITFNLTDGTSSYTAKIFGEKIICKELLDKVGNGSTVMIRGSIGFDTYLHTYIIDTKAVTLIEKIEKTDDAPEKRVELHLHTKMSAMDAVSSAKDLVTRAAKWGHKAIAITDHGNIQAFPEAFATAGKLGIKVIYGMEAYFVDDLSNPDADVMSQNYYHQIILVKNNTGLKNLYKLITASNLEFFRKKPRIPKSRLIEHREGLIIGSACEAGELYRAIVFGESEERITEIASFYDYLEIQPNGNNRFMIRSQREEYADIQSDADLENINRKIIALGDKLGKPVV